MPNLPAYDDFTPQAGRITAVLGPTNTGKTHYALERMLAYRSGMIGLPLRLLAREIYDRVVAIRGARDVALVTGEEKITPPNPSYWVATVEAMPLEREVDFLAIDEIQLAADPERGRVFTSRILHARGLSETLLLGADTMRPVLQRLFRNIQFLSRERLSQLTYAGPKKVTRLPRRSAVVVFSADSVYAIAELIRRQRGGAAVVLGALSPRTRNAQAELYQSGEVDFLVATDAIGMGLNMDIDQVAFAAKRKFDGRRPRDLGAGEMAQIAGRAGRYLRDGAFGVTADCPALDEDMVQAIEEHAFPPVEALQWRSETIDFSSPPALMRSLERSPPRPVFVRSRRGDDEDALRRLMARDDIAALAGGGAALARLWDICQIPDFRKISADQHARLLGDLYLALMKDGRIGDDYLEQRVNRLDRVDGDIDSISTRIAHVRTWTFLSHRPAWLESGAYWQERTRAIEDKLSDALHEKLTQRFVDRRTSTLIRRLKDDAPLLAGVTDDGEVIVEGQFIGRLLGFEFIVDPRASGAEAKQLRAAGERALRPVLAARAAALANASAGELSLRDDGAIWWRSARVAKLQKGPTPLRPDVVVTGLAEITANMRGRVEDRLKEFVAAKIEGALGPLIALQNAANASGDDGLQGLTKGVAFRLVENFGATSRTQFGDDLKQIEQTERAKLRKIGVRFGEYTLFVPALLKPAPAKLLILLWALWNDKNPHETPPPKAGLVSLEMEEALPHAYYYAAGYRPSGTRAVRIDMLERLARLIRAARSDANMREGFEANAQMMSLVGCSGEEFEGIMRSLGLRKHMVKRKIAPNRAKEEARPVAQGAETAPAANGGTEAPAQGAGEGKAGAAPAEAPSIERAAPVAATPPAPAPVEANAQSPVGDSAPTLEASEEARRSPSHAAEKKPAEASADPAAGEAQEIEVALWRPAPRKPFNKAKRAPKPEAKGAQRRDGKDKRRKGGQPRGPKGLPRENMPMHEPRHRRTADPNSPFAVLAELKPQLSNNEETTKAKTPEKAE